MSFEANRIPVERWLALLAGLTLAGCEKPAQEVTPEKPQDPTPAAAAAASVQAKEVPSAVPAASGKPPAEKEKTCAPGGCSPGACGGAK